MYIFDLGESHNKNNNNNNNHKEYSNTYYFLLIEPRWLLLLDSILVIITHEHSIQNKIFYIYISKYLFEYYLSWSLK